ncbi:MAG: hypothetical protein KBD16_04430 [Candidatus Pacebacteria bacterium]|nr:hypothetical protein [Candidatus Paceibacterota bacterium]
MATPQGQDFITVRVGQLPGRIQEVALNGERTVGAAIEGAELDESGFEVRVNGRPAESTQQLRQGGHRPPGEEDQGELKPPHQVLCLSSRPRQDTPLCGSGQGLFVFYILFFISFK